MPRFTVTRIDPNSKQVRVPPKPSRLAASVLITATGSFFGFGVWILTSVRATEAPLPFVAAVASIYVAAIGTIRCVEWFSVVITTAGVTQYRWSWRARHRRRVCVDWSDVTRATSDGLHIRLSSDTSEVEIATAAFWDAKYVHTYVGEQLGRNGRKPSWT